MIPLPVFMVGMSDVSLHWYAPAGQEYGFVNTKRHRRHRGVVSAAAMMRRRHVSDFYTLLSHTVHLAFSNRERQSS